MEEGQRLTVFVSSTSRDLKDYREVAKDVILSLGWHPEMMEHWGAGPVPTVNECRARLRPCDLVLMVVAFQKGWVPAADQGGDGKDSITAIEHAYALERGIPVLAMLASDTWPGYLWEKGQDD